MKKKWGSEPFVGIQDFLSDGVGELADDVSRWKKDYARVWWDTEHVLPEFKKEYSFREQKEIENDVTALFDELSSKIQKYPLEKSRQEEWIEDLVGDLKKYGRDRLRISDAYIDSVFKQGFVRTTREFVDRVKEFDPRMGIENVYQALRNVWIMNALQIYMGLEIKHTDAIFAYSLIYPYTDNYLDDDRMFLRDKFSLTQDLKKWLEGEKAEPKNGQQEKIYLLIKKIESQYDRKRYPRVYQSLLSIFNGQIRSLTQQRRQSLPYETDILDISLEKGGTSVLADGYLVKGHLDEEEADFCFGFGLFLQLADDIQDIGEDLKNNHMTVFSQSAGHHKLDKLANKLFQFMPNILDAKLKNTNENRKKLRGLILDNCNFLVMEAVGKNKSYFDEDYVEHIERFFPVRFSFLKTLRNKVQSRFLDKNKTVIDMDFVSTVLLTIASRTVL